MYSPGRPGVNQRKAKQAFWKHIATGLPSEDAALASGASQPLGPRWFREAGGMPPLSLAPNSGRYLSFAEREELALLKAQRYGVREIARRLGRSPNGRPSGQPCARSSPGWPGTGGPPCKPTCKLGSAALSWASAANRSRGPPCHGRGGAHGRRADRRWGMCWSPEPISRRLRVDFPHDVSMRISHEAIYQALYVQGRGALRRELSACLRTGRALRVPRARTQQRGKPFITPEVMISQRPAEIANRAVPGHWEGDLIIGPNRSAIGTLVERTTRFTMLLHLPSRPGYAPGACIKNGPALAGHGAEAVRDAIAAKIAVLPEQLRRSLTWDQGAEMARHARLRIETGLAIYFCDPRSPWQRGTNENTNGLLRQYFPKGTDIGRYSAHELDAVAATLNSRPRKTLGWETPAEALAKRLISAQQTGVATIP